jgi:hypothetical protein
MRRLIVWIVWFAISFSMEAQQPVKVYVKDGIAVDSMISTVCPILNQQNDTTYVVNFGRPGVNPV